MEDVLLEITDSNRAPPYEKHSLANKHIILDLVAPAINILRPRQMAVIIQTIYSGASSYI